MDKCNRCQSNRPMLYEQGKVRVCSVCLNEEHWDKIEERRSAQQKAKVKDE